jgi:hypothetical protein
LTVIQMEVLPIVSILHALNAQNCRLKIRNYIRGSTHILRMTIVTIASKKSIDSMLGAEIER